MSNKKGKKCTVTTKTGQMSGTVIDEYEESGGADDGAIFAIIQLENGQVITVKMSEIFDE